MTPSLAIGIPTFNRPAILRLAAQALARCVLPPGTRILVVDDASEDYDEKFLREIFPTAEVTRREANSGGADFATRDLLARLVATGAELLLILDSDLLIASDAFVRALPLVGQSDGLLSLFNTPTHATLARNGALVEKASVGAAGTLWTRDLASAVLANVPPEKVWDLRAGDHVRATGRRIFATADSLVQHIGFAGGENSSALNGDIGIGFHDPDPRTLYALAEALMRHELANNNEMMRRVLVLERRIRRLPAPARAFVALREIIRRMTRL